MADKESDPRETLEDTRKVFITNIDGIQNEDNVGRELERLFIRYGKITKLVVKKNKNGLYYFAFLEY